MDMNKGKQILLVYFSGTGGTERAAACMEKSLISCGCEVEKISLEKRSKSCKEISSECIKAHSLIAIIYPVHAFDAPEPVYRFIRSIPEGKGMRAAVISVSGGGEVFPNKACRAGCIKALQRMGYDVYYERMLIMPSNIFINTKEHLAMHLLKALPLKADHCIKELLCGVRRRSRPQLSSSIMTALGKLEKPGARIFGRKLQATEVCTGCGWCEQSCPMENIHMEAGRPKFGGKCVACLRCVYGCPSSAIKPKVFRVLTVKEGYDLNKLEQRMPGVELEPVEKLATGVFTSLREYLLHVEV